MGFWMSFWSQNILKLLKHHLREHFKNSDLVETYSYDANHAFSRGNGVHYDEACAKRANERSYAFIDKALK